MSVAVGEKVPHFTGVMTGGTDFDLNDYAGKNILIYFYPKDNTPGCTQEGKDIRDNIASFDDKNISIIGLSRDGIKMHENFKAKHEFPFNLISDKDEAICQLFDVIKEKKLYGKVHMGIERSTFIIDTNGTLIKEWRKVKVKVHIDELLEFIQTL